MYLDEDKYESAILPTDFMKNGPITNDEMNEILVKPLPAGTKLIAVFDCCRIGSNLNLSFVYNPEGKAEHHEFHWP